jgi:hypothetical protein
MDRFDKGSEPGDGTQEAGGPSLDDAVDSLFMQSFEELSNITSGDEETDRAIDLAVDTLFVEEPETVAPETTQLEATVVEPAVPVEEPPASPLEGRAKEEPKEDLLDIPMPGLESSPTPEEAPVFEEPVFEEPPAEEAARFDDFEFETGFEEQAAAQERASEADLVIEPDLVPEPGLVPKPDPELERKSQRIVQSEIEPVKKLQEAILTLEWEISSRSVTALANELQKVRTRFQDNVTVDFAALAMRLVLDYVVKRMSRAHPESIRFLLEVSRYLEGCVNSSKQDPLGTFHQILTRYESYKSTVRRAEGLPDTTATAKRGLEIRDPEAFSGLVKRQAATLAIAGLSLARRIESARDPEDLIRSFRFLVTRSFNRILDNTQKAKKRKRKKKKKRRRANR